MKMKVIYIYNIQGHAYMMTHNTYSGARGYSIHRDTYPVSCDVHVNLLYDKQQNATKHAHSMHVHVPYTEA